MTHVEPRLCDTGTLLSGVQNDRFGWCIALLTDHRVEKATKTGEKPQSAHPDHKVLNRQEVEQESNEHLETILNLPATAAKN